MFSLIIATIGRTTELSRLLESLRRQSMKDFEIIVVDQNAGNRLEPVLHAYSDLQIVHLRSQPGASRARNVGLRASSGDVIATPDDDCWYADNLLSSVRQWLESHHDYDVLFTDVRSPDDKPMRPMWPPSAGPCTKSNVWDCTVAFTGFFRRKVVDAIGGFDEHLGPGPDTLFKACEDIDFCIRPLLLNFRMWYEPTLWVYHPEFQSLDRLRRITHPYALAYGYVLRIHRYSLGYLARRICRSLAGFAWWLCRGKFSLARLYLVRAIGQFRGYACGPTYAMRHEESSRRPFGRS